MTTSTWVIFRDKMEAILSVGAEFFGPIAAIAASFFGFSPAVTAVLRGIPALMAIVEEASPAPGTGPAKSAQVMTMAKDLMNFAGAQTTGGAKESFDKYKPLIQATINASIGMVNKVAPQIIANDAPAASPLAPVDTP